MKKYKKPQVIRIGNNPDTRKLYVAEAAFADQFKTQAELLGKALGYDPEQFYTHSLPHALQDFLDHWDSKAAILACISTLEKEGFTITKDGKPLDLDFEEKNKS